MDERGGLYMLVICAMKYALAVRDLKFFGAQVKFWRSTNSKTVTIFSFSIEIPNNFWGGRRPPPMYGRTVYCLYYNRTCTVHIRSRPTSAQCTS